VYAKGSWHEYGALAGAGRDLVLNQQNGFTETHELRKKGSFYKPIKK
jgi:hypothetical protein